MEESYDSYMEDDFNEKEYDELLQNYISCIYVEKLYRSNRFFI